MKRQSEQNFLIGFFILSWLAIMLLISAFGFLFNLSISFIHFPLSILLSIFFNIFATKYYFKDITLRNFKHLSLLIILFIICILLCSYIYDISYDGQWYHQETVIQLYNGWNPFNQKLADANIPTAILFINHYAKGTEICQAVIYRFFQKIEVSKITNLLLIAASFSLCASLLFKVLKISNLKIYAVSLLLAFNPVTILQAFTFCVDGQLASLLLCIIILLAYSLLYFDKYVLVLLGAVIIIIVNTKFTAILFIGVLLLGLLLMAIILKKNRVFFLRIIAVSSISILGGVLLVGFNPYATNTIQHHNPFYPISGKGKVDVISMQVPKGFLNKNRFQNLVYSIFSRTENVLSTSKEPASLKIPFSFNYSEIKASGDIDIRVGGFGIFFSGILLLSILLAIMIIPHLEKLKLRILACAFLILLSSILIFPEPWWSRYIPQLWYLPFIVILFAEDVRNKSILWIKSTTYLIILLNIMIILTVRMTKNIVATQIINYQLSQIKSVNDKVTINFKMFQSNRIRFNENNINFYNGIVEQNKHIIKIYRSQTEVGFDNEMVEIPKPLSLRYFEKE